MHNLLVTGAAGQMGSVVTETLLKKMTPQQINVLVRKEEKQQEFQTKGFNAYQGNYEDIASLERAMTGVDTVLLISSGDKQNHLQQHKNVIDTAKKCGIENIAYTSRSLRDRNTVLNQILVEHFETEDYIKASRLKYIIFKVARYMETLLFHLDKDVIEKGGFAGFAGDGKAAFTLRKDLSEGIANVLLNENCNNQTYTFTNTETYSMYDVADALTQLSGKEITYTPVDVPTFETLMNKTGLPPFVVKIMCDTNLDIKNGQETVITNDLEKALGRKPTSLKGGLKLLYHL